MTQQAHDTARDISLAEDIAVLRDRAVATAFYLQPFLDAIPPDRLPSARNLAHYLGVRREDIRHIQKRLARRGLSSLGRCEAAVLPTLDAVLHNLSILDGAPPPPPKHPLDVADLDQGHHLLDAHSEAALGPRPHARVVRIMLTLPTEAADNPDIINDALAAGADLIRINTAHDSPDHWSRMIDHLRDTSKRLDRPARILIDLPGPKIRVTRVDAPHNRDKRVHTGDTLVLIYDDAQHPDLAPDAPRLHTSHPRAFATLRPGDRVFYDDAKFAATVHTVTHGAVVIRIDLAPEEGAKLKKDKGLNLPDTDIDLPALTAFDEKVLADFAHRVDLVGLSFARKPVDLERLFDLLAPLQQSAPGVVLKIETRQGFEHLPELLLTLLRWHTSAVMIARGDLAVEVGFERLAEAQEEILWLCESSHTPIIWATQVLESLAKTGQPSRAEITDAAMAQRAECVMLNKGEHALKAVRVLDDLLRRMASHQRKKTPMLRALNIAGRFPPGPDAEL